MQELKHLLGAAGKGFVVGRPFQRASSTASNKALQVQSKPPVFTGGPDYKSRSVGVIIKLIITI